jgi:hypothetical protein
MRFFLFALIAIVGLIDVGTASAAWTIAPPGSQKSKDIKAMNIMDRPNRLLHVYGDTGADGEPPQVTAIVPPSVAEIPQVLVASRPPSYAGMPLDIQRLFRLFS